MRRNGPVRNWLFSQYFPAPRDGHHGIDPRVECGGIAPRTSPGRRRISKKQPVPAGMTVSKSIPCHLCMDGPRMGNTGFDCLLSRFCSEIPGRDDHNRGRSVLALLHDGETPGRFCNAHCRVSEMDSTTNQAEKRDETWRNATSMRKSCAMGVGGKLFYA